jgi:hypothetical protein
VHVALLAAMAIGWFAFSSEHDGESGIDSLGTGILVAILAVAGLVHALVSTIALSFCAHRRFAAPLVHLAILLVVVVGGFFAFFTPVATS